MIAKNFSEVRKNLKTYCDLAVDENETIIVTRHYDRNVVIMSVEQYNLMHKNLRLEEYYAQVAKLFKSKKQENDQSDQNEDQ